MEELAGRGIGGDTSTETLRSRFRCHALNNVEEHFRSMEIDARSEQALLLLGVVRSYVVVG